MSKEILFNSLSEEQREFIQFLLDESWSNGYQEGLWKH